MSPKITVIERQKRRSRRCSLFIDGNFVCGVDEEIVLKLNLEVGQEVDEAQIRRIIFKEEARKAKDYALNLLSFRPRSTKEVRDRATKTKRETGCNTGENHPNWQGGVSKTKGLCSICGIEHEWDTWAFNKSDNHFCSRECMGVWFSRNKSGENNPNFQDRITHFKCDQCGKDVSRKSSEYEKYKTHFCSNECDNKYRVENGLFALENSPNWKGGTSFLPYPPEWT